MGLQLVLEKSDVVMSTLRGVRASEQGSSGKRDLANVVLERHLEKEFAKNQNQRRWASTQGRKDRKDS